MTSSLLLHSRVKQNAQTYIDNPGHAVLISGPAGSGKRSLADYITANLLGVPTEKISQYPYFMLIEQPADKQEISIDSVREVIRKLKLKTVIESKGLVSRVVLIDGAQNLSAEAQSALLKAIEEPPAKTVFILTATSDTAVLPTISSRAQKLAVLPVSLDEAQTYYKNQYGGDKIDSAWRLSGGLGSLMSALLKNDDSHPLKQAVEQTKKFLTMSQYDRLLFIDSFSNNKAEIKSLLDALSRVLAALSYSAVKAGNQRQSQKLIKARKLVNSTAEDLSKNVSLRLAVLNLVLKLPV
jgi:DNA polymerase III subunit delta'